MKTIEEKAREFAEKRYGHYRNSHQVRYMSVYDSIIIAEDACKQGLKDFLKLPLIEKLTDLEKEQIRKEWANAHNNVFWHIKPYLRGRFMVLQDIFGSDFFKKEVTNDN